MAHEVKINKRKSIKNELKLIMLQDVYSYRFGFQNYIELLLCNLR